MSLLAEYLAVILLDAASAESDESFGGSIKSISRSLTHKFGRIVREDDVREALNILIPFAAAEDDFSPLTGGFWTVNFDNFRYYFLENRPQSEDDLQDYAEVKELTKKHKVLLAYSRKGHRYALDASNHLSEGTSDDWDALRSNDFDDETAAIPAAGRTVNLSHNQIEILESTAGTVVDKLELENSIDGNFDLRSQFIGQIKAARELFRSGCVRVHLAYDALNYALNFIVKKYKGQALGEAAKKLLDLCIEHLWKQL